MRFLNQEMDEEAFSNKMKQTLARRAPKLMGARAEYAVLVPLVSGEEGLHLLYEVRASTLRRQPGEVCFPGGRMERGETAIACALRETEEELGIAAEEICILGELDFFVHRGNFILYPVLAQISARGMAQLRINKQEVDKVFMPPLSYLRAHPPQMYSYRLIPTPPENFPYEVIGIAREYRWPEGGEKVPVYQYQEHAIWGMTGHITNHLLSIIEKIEQEEKG